MTEPQVPFTELPGGVRMPMVGFGTWPMRGRQASVAVRHALDAGYRHIDTATMYSNEADVGRALAESRLPRDEVFLTTKLRARDAGRERAVLQASVQALGTDHVDLWLVHWPPRNAGPAVWRELLAARQAGLARAVGVSNHSVAEIDELIDATGETPAVNQVHWNPGRHDPEFHDAMRSRGVALEAYSPLKDTNLRDPVLAGIASAHEVTAAQVVLRWHLEHGITVLAKSADPERIAANLDLFGFSLSPDEVASIDGLATRRSRSARRS